MFKIVVSERKSFKKVSVESTRGRTIELTSTIHGEVKSIVLGKAHRWRCRVGWGREEVGVVKAA